MGTNLSHRRPPSSPPQGPSRRAKLIKTTPHIQPCYSSRMNRTTAFAYSSEVTQALLRDAQEEPPHTVSHLLVAANETQLIVEEQHIAECEQYFWASNFRELNTVLLSHLIGIKHPHTAVIEQLFPEHHFLKWLSALPSDEKKMRVFDTPQVAVQLLHAQGNLNNHTPLASPPPPLPQLPPLALGKASSLTVGDLSQLLLNLSKASNAGNHLIHRLSVGNVVRVLNDLRARKALGQQSVYHNLVCLVEAILGWSIFQPNTKDYKVDFKNMVKEFREKVEKGYSSFISKVEQEWKVLYKDAELVARTEELIKRGFVVAKVDHDKLVTDHNKLEEGHNKLTEDYAKTQSELQALTKFVKARLPI